MNAILNISFVDKYLSFSTFGNIRHVILTKSDEKWILKQLNMVAASQCAGYSETE